MDDNHCERDILDFKTIFESVDKNQWRKESSSEENMEQMDKLSGIELNQKFGQFAQNFNSNKDSNILEDFERNSLFKSFTLKTTYKDFGIDELLNNTGTTPRKYNLRYEGYKIKKELENLSDQTTQIDGDIMVFEFEGFEIQKRSIGGSDSTNYFDTGLKEEEQVQNMYIFNPEVLEKVLSKIYKKSSNLKNLKEDQNIEGMDELSDEEDNDQTEESDDNLLDVDELELPEAPIDRYNLSNFPVKPLIRFRMINYNDSDSEETEQHGETFFAVQTKIKTKEGRLLETDSRSKAEILKEIQNLFSLLPKCIQRAIQQCPMKMSKVKERCEKHYEEIGKDKYSCKEYISNPMRIVLKCDDDEELINDACYKRCPDGLKDAKLFCVKNKYIKKSIVPYKKQVIKKNEYLWGESFVARRCSSFGNLMKNGGSDYCRIVCPASWFAHGLFCEKPYRFLNQNVYLFKSVDVAKNN